jgi:hypothetical protein
MQQQQTQEDRFSRTFIESLYPKVKKIDSDENIDLFCYTTCDDSDPVHIRSCRGLVFNKDKLVLKAYSYNPDYTTSDYERLNATYPDVSKFTFFDSYEGSLIRVFFTCDKWYVSTHRRLDAFKSKWSSRVSFGDCFLKSLEYEFSTSDAFRQRILSSPMETENTTATILEKFLSTLDTGRQYMFLLQNNNENRIVCDSVEYPTVFHVGTFIVDGCLDLDINVDLSTPKKHSFSTMREVVDYVKSTDYTKIQGVIMFSETEQIKIMTTEYMYYFNLRGNEASIKNRYLQIRMDSEKKKSFQELYHSHQQVFDELEDVIYDISLQIFNAYLNRFIHKKHVTMPPEEYSVMKECHSWHILDRTHNHISMEKVMSTLNSQSPPKINKMIRRYFNNQRFKILKLEEEVQNSGTEIAK